MPARPSPLLSRRACLALLTGGPLAACAGGPVFKAQAGAETLAEQPVLQVLTTRRLAKPGASPFFDHRRAVEPIYARASLSAPDPSALGRLASLVSDDFAVQELDDLRHSGAVTAFVEALRGRDTLLYVHGYNQTFEKAALDAASLSQGVGFRGNTALFAWPSKAGLLDYGYDRESALLARDTLADALSAVLQDPFGARVHLVAHSMGTWLTLEALRAYRDRHQETGLDRMGALVFASPDIDADVFRAGLGRIGGFRNRLTVITATNDRALDLSRRLAGGERVGALPREALEGTGVKVVDATEFAGGFVRHDAFVANPDVRAVIKRAIERA